MPALGGVPSVSHAAPAFLARLEGLAWLLLPAAAGLGVLLALFGRPRLLFWCAAALLLLSGGGAFLLALVKYVFTGG